LIGVVPTVPDNLSALKKCLHHEKKGTWLLQLYSFDITLCSSVCTNANIEFSSLLARRKFVNKEIEKSSHHLLVQGPKHRNRSCKNSYWNRKKSWIQVYLFCFVFPNQSNKRSLLTRPWELESVTVTGTESSKEVQTAGEPWLLLILNNAPLLPIFWSRALFTLFQSNLEMLWQQEHKRFKQPKF
jgi:hypothetical protein